MFMEYIGLYLAGFSIGLITYHLFRRLFNYQYALIPPALAVIAGGIISFLFLDRTSSLLFCTGGLTALMFTWYNSRNVRKRKRKIYINRYYHFDKHVSSNRRNMSEYFDEDVDEIIEYSKIDNVKENLDLFWWRRMVNCWFADARSAIKRDENLVPGKDYFYELNIGTALSESIIETPVLFPDNALSSYFTTNGLPLRVELFSHDFNISDPSGQLILLPLDGADSARVSFRITTPSRPGIARMRVGIYYRLNLIQSLMVTAWIGENSNDSKLKPGNSAIVDYTLSDFSNLDNFSERHLNIALNDNNKTHSLYIANSGLKKQFEFGENQVRTIINAARTALLNICRVIEDGEPVYRFRNNKGNEKDFSAEIIKLALQGYALYAQLLLPEPDNSDFEINLKKELALPGRVIQVASTRSARYVIPWALMYDNNLVEGNNKVCPVFFKEIKKPAFQDTPSCILNGCPHKEDSSVVCPSHFWGYKHIIEQPISVREGSLPFSISTTGTFNVMMAVSKELQDYKKHAEEIKAINKSIVNIFDTKESIGGGLKKNDLQVVYFYCHGGKEPAYPFLGVGNNQKIIPTDLLGWKISWPAFRPLIFVNGCHTLDMSPDDFILFNDVFSKCNASGVLGTEISIVESLARYFSLGFLNRFSSGKNVGESLREQRLEMLRNLNLLGLAYTAYCSADLKIQTNLSSQNFMLWK